MVNIIRNLPKCVINLEYERGREWITLKYSKDFVQTSKASPTAPEKAREDGHERTENKYRWQRTTQSSDSIYIHILRDWGHNVTALTPGTPSLWPSLGPSLARAWELSLAARQVGIVACDKPRRSQDQTYLPNLVPRLSRACRRSPR